MEHILYFMDQRLVLDPDKEYKIGRTSENHIILNNKTVSRHHGLLFFKDTSWFIKDSNSTNGISVNGIRIKSKRLFDRDKIRIADYNLEYREGESGEDKTLSPSDTIIIEKEIASIVDKIGDEKLADKIFSLKGFLNKRKDKLAALAYKDELTGLYNRRFMDERISGEVSRARRYGRDLAFIMIDIDHFKQINDKYGHPFGDEILKYISDIIKSISRINDQVCRYGGEEIAVILPETSFNAAYKVAEKYRETIEKDTRKKYGFEVTVSIGVSIYNSLSENASEMIDKADKALYQAKKSGRNRVIAAGI